MKFFGLSAWIFEKEMLYVNIAFSSISATGATKGLRRFGQSIKRVVREVKEDSGSNAIFLYYLCPYIPYMYKNPGSIDTVWKKVISKTPFSCLWGKMGKMGPTWA